jgi:hypothetical protein
MHEGQEHDHDRKAAVLTRRLPNWRRYLDIDCQSEWTAPVIEIL